jgi:2-phosphosulfolactate phosphatase
MQIFCDHLLEGARRAEGTAVIVDVFRAFTCTPLLFALGIEKSILVSSREQAFALRENDPRLILVGEINGMPIQGFDLGNSPSEILGKGSSFFERRTVVQRTSSGVQGVLAAMDVADEVLLGSYVIAKATARYILGRKPQRVSLVAMGWNLEEVAPEDEWCVRYFSHLLENVPYNHLEALREIVFHRTTQKFLRMKEAYFPPEDPLLCLQRDLFDFAVKAKRQGDLVVADKILPNGLSIWREISLQPPE